MNLVSDIARRSGGWGWFFVSALFGSSWALASVSLGPLLLIPTALLGVFLWRWRPAARRSVFGLLSGRDPSALRGVGTARRTRDDLLAYRYRLWL
jgi:hypothetical protein